MPTVRTSTIRIKDVLGYAERDVIARLKHMAEDAVNGVNEEAVKEEAAILRARLKGGACASH